MLLTLLACDPAPRDSAAPEAACTPATPEDIRTRRGDYYRCLDSTLVGGEGCGAEGYPLGFGARYADRSFDETWDTLGPEGQAFFLAVSPCLQSRLAGSVTAASTCDEVWSAGFATHAGCYVESGFCDLPTDDLAAIVDSFDAETMELPEFADTLLEVAEACLE